MAKLTPAMHKAAQKELWEQRQENRKLGKGMDPKLEADINYQMRLLICEFKSLPLEPQDQKRFNAEKKKQSAAKGKVDPIS